MSQKRELPILYVVPIGNPEFERFHIEDQHGRTWNGERFDSDGGALFAEHNHASIITQNILRKSFDGGVAHRYVVPLYVEVLSHGEPVSLAEVAEYLSRGARLYLDTAANGNGPGESLVLPWIEWHRIDTIKEFPND